MKDSSQQQRRKSAAYSINYDSEMSLSDESSRHYDKVFSAQLQPTNVLDSVLDRFASCITPWGTVDDLGDKLADNNRMDDLLTCGADDYRRSDSKTIRSRRSSRRDRAGDDSSSRKDSRSRRRSKSVASKSRRSSRKVAPVETEEVVKRIVEGSGALKRPPVPFNQIEVHPEIQTKLSDLTGNWDFVASGKSVASKASGDGNNGEGRSSRFGFSASRKKRTK